MLELGRGAISKMRIALDAPAQYSLRLNDEQHALNPLIGQTLRLEFLGSINCTHCDRLTKKSFGQGYCWPCFSSLVACGSWMVRPERFHLVAGTCREPEVVQDGFVTDELVDLANAT